MSCPPNPQHAPEAAEAICRLIQDPALRRQLGGNLRGKVESEYSTDALAPAWQQVFDAVIREAQA